MSKLTSRTSSVYNAPKVGKLLQVSYSDKQHRAFGIVPDGLPGFVTFFDPGWSILRVRDCVAGKDIFYPEGWYDYERFAKLEEPPRYRQLQMKAVNDSFGKTLAERQTLVPSDAEIPTARVVLMGIVIHYLATGERLFCNYWVRCADRTSGGCFASVGVFDRGTVVGIGSATPNGWAYDLGVVLSRKF